MDDICRLCCSTKFVNNNLFDEENALFLKLSLYLPIKIFKNDRLPQKVCDKCSCKVNDFYQFCNETIEVQNRLRTLFLTSEPCSDGTDHHRLVRGSASPPTLAVPCDRSTQTVTSESEPVDCHETVQVKEEPKSIPSLSPVKKEEDINYTIDSDNFEDRSSDSEDISLINLKKKKNSKKSAVNGTGSEKRGRKKKANLKDWEDLMSSLPDGPLTVVDNGDSRLPLDIIKVEIEDKPPKFDEDVFHCCICFSQCYGRTEMLQHYRAHAPEAANEPPPAPAPPDREPLRCTRCRKVVARAEWGQHWARHWERDRRPYCCALCQKAFRAPHQILKHVCTQRLGEGKPAEPLSKRFVCDLCPEAFVYMRYLLSHRTRAHPEAAGRALALRCAVCARDFAHINSLRRHLRAHSGERNFLCNVCGKALTSREHLKHHIRIHTGYKPHVCKTCGKGFVKKCNLTLHERVHSGEKPHVCSHCKKAFSQRSTLVIHERYHSGARPYVCALCGRGFVAKGLLSMHLKTTCI